VGIKVGIETAAQRYCMECSKHHFLESFCSGCGVCLFKNGIDLKDEKYPLYDCQKCGKRNLWD
jgi:hypothetical protein